MNWAHLLTPAEPEDRGEAEKLGHIGTCWRLERVTQAKESTS